MNYSYTKNSNPIEFIKKRCRRILPIYIPAMLILNILELSTRKIDVVTCFKNITTISFWTGEWLELWFVIAIMTLYLLIPPYYKWYNKNPKKTTYIAVILSTVFSMLFFNKNILIFFSRIPIFLIGFYVGELVKKDKKISVKEMIIQMAGAAIAFAILMYVYIKHQKILWHYGMHWYPFIFITLPVTLIISWIFEKLNKIKYINTSFVWLSKYTLEICIFHPLILKYTQGLQKYISFDNRNILYNIIIFTAVLILSAAYNKVIYIGMEYADKIKARKNSSFKSKV